MLRLHSLIIALLFVSSLLPAQIHLVGSHYNGGLGTVSVFRWDATTGLATDTVPTPSTGIVISSSVFDAYNDAYYYADGSGMNRIDLDSNSFTALGGTLLGNSTEIDMATAISSGLPLWMSMTPMVSCLCAARIS